MKSILISEDNEERLDLALQYPEKLEQLKQILNRETNSQRPDLR